MSFPNALGATIPGGNMQPLPGQMRPLSTQTVGMVPGVPGSMGLNPGGMSFPPVSGPSPAPMGGPPAGGPMPAPPHGPPAGMVQFRNALMDWRQQRPSFDPSNPQGFHQSMMQWHQQRPLPTSYFGQSQGPVMTPGGGGTGAPLQGGQMTPLSPTAGQMPLSGPFQLPSY